MQRSQGDREEQILQADGGSFLQPCRGVLVMEALCSEAYFYKITVVSIQRSDSWGTQKRSRKTNKETMIILSEERKVALITVATATAETVKTDLIWLCES